MKPFTFVSDVEVFAYYTAQGPCSVLLQGHGDVTPLRVVVEVDGFGVSHATLLS